MQHYSVMKNTAIEFLNLKSDSIVVDATLGLAGHSKEILKQIPKGFLYAFDLDKNSLEYAQNELDKVSTNYKIFSTNFVNMKECLRKEGIKKVDAILFDLGVSSPQIDDATRGFSFMQDGILDMRMNKEQTLDAKKIIKEYSKEELTDIFFKYGEEKRSKIIADFIVKKRIDSEITTTLELVEIIKNAVGSKYFYEFHPERKIFQALRIEVNQELVTLEKVLPDAISLLKKGGRIVVITFHSLEDRIVKNIFKKYSMVDEMVKGLPNIPDEFLPEIKIINKKPIIASNEELKENRRSKSAKLRVIEKVI